MRNVVIGIVLIALAIGSFNAAAQHGGYVLTGAGAVGIVLVFRGLFSRR